jgi:hypothetical protein
MRLRRGYRPFEAYFNGVVRAITEDRMVKGKLKRGKPWLMSYQDFMTFMGTPGCHYCGAAIEWPAYSHGGDRYNRRMDKSNLDRKDNDVAYTKENCVVCCYSCNVTKSSKLTYEEMVAVGNIRRERPRVIGNCPNGFCAEPVAVVMAVPEPDPQPSLCW